MPQTAKKTKEKVLPKLQIEGIGQGIDAGSARLVHITPELAAEWLERNTFNRPLRQSRIDRYARDMAAHNWKLSHQGMALDKRGRILDGQHRLWAVVESGVAIDSYVFFDLPDDVRIVTDDHEPRQTRDVLYFMGHEVRHDVPGVLKRMLRGIDKRWLKLSHKEEEAMYIKHKASLEFMVEQFARNVPRVTSSSVKAVVCRAWYTQSHAKLKRFVVVLCEGVRGEATERPILLLRDQLMKGRRLGHAPLSPHLSYVKCQTALHAYLNGRKMTKLQGVENENLFRLPDESEVTDKRRENRGSISAVYKYVTLSSGHGVTASDVARQLNITLAAAGLHLRRAAKLGWIMEMPGERKRMRGGRKLWIRNPDRRAIRAARTGLHFDK